MRRRDFVSLIGGIAAGWPSAVRAQQPDRVRRVGILMDIPQNDRGVPRLRALLSALEELGWHEGRNLALDVRWNANTLEKSRELAGQLLALHPEVILTSASSSTAAMRQLSTSVPVVFVLVTDPVGAGFVDSLARPGGNFTGFTLFEYAIAAKWLELLKELAPKTRRVGVLRDANVAAGAGQFGVLDINAKSLNVELVALGVGDAAEIERGIAAFAPRDGDGLIVTASPLASLHREQIIALADRHRLPTVFPYGHFVAAGGLLSYGPDLVDPFRRAASYVNRILKGEKTSELPVQAPTNYALAINARTAAALGLAIPSSLLVRADEVIE